tara:strand:+ start:228 stop:1136 length:909 start_codon:yes stop_codon:yes gene_type:complete
MANTTFQGPVRSEGGFRVISKNSTTGAITTGTALSTVGAHLDSATVTGTTTVLGNSGTDAIIGKGSHNGVVANPYAESATQLFPLGTMLRYGNNVYRYGKMGAGAVTAGKLVQNVVHEGADHKNMTATAAVAAGLYEISVETNGTDLTLDEYAGGYLYVNDVAGEGQTFRVKSHPAHDHSDDPSVVITTFDPVATALTTSSQLTIVKDPYSGLIVAPHAETGRVMGATVRDMQASYFGWFVVEGPQSLLTQGTVVVGNAITRATGTTDGAVQAAGDDVSTVVGECMVVNPTTEYSLIWLNIN